MKSLDEMPEGSEEDLLQDREDEVPRFPQQQQPYRFMDAMQAPRQISIGAPDNNLVIAASAFDLVDGLLDTFATRGRLLLRLGHYDGKACPKCEADLKEDPEFDNLCTECDWMSKERLADELMYGAKWWVQGFARGCNMLNNWALSRRWVGMRAEKLPPGVSKADHKVFEKIYKRWRKEIADPYIRPSLEMDERDVFIQALNLTKMWAQSEYKMSPEEADRFLNVSMDRFTGKMRAEKEPVHDLLAAKRYQKAWVKPTAREKEREAKLSRYSTKK